MIPAFAETTLSENRYPLRFRKGMLFAIMLYSAATRAARAGL